MTIAVILGTIAVVWGFCTFLIRVNVIEVWRGENETFIIRVDDGYISTDKVSVVQHCLARREWNLRNDIKVKAFWPVTTNEVVNLGCLFEVNHIYPTDTPWEMNGPKGKSYFKWRNCQYADELMRLQMETRKNNNANQAMHQRPVVAP